MLFNAMQSSGCDSFDFKNNRSYPIRATYNTDSVHVKKARIWSLRQFYHYLILKGHVRENIALDLAYPRIEKTVPQFLTIGEYNRILEHCFLCADTEAGLRNLIIVMLLGMLGLRTNAVIGLNIQDVNLPAGLLWIREKGGIARIVIMPKVMCRLIQHYLSDRNDHRGPLFLTRRNKRLSPRCLQDMFARIVDAVGIDKHLHAHLFRHTAGTHLNKTAGTDMCRSEYVYHRLRRFRAGIESGISWLKRSMGLARCIWKGWHGFKSYVWSSIVAANLLTIARSKLKPV